MRTTTRIGARLSQLAGSVSCACARSYGSRAGHKSGEQQPCQCFSEPAKKRYAFEVRRKELATVPAVAREGVGELAIHVGPEHERCNLEIETKASVIEIRRADDGQVVIAQHRLRVDEPRLVLEDTYSCLHELGK